VISYMLPHMHM